MTFRNLEPRQTPFVGRGDVLAALRDAVRGSRIVTVVGTAGAGKTRTTIEAISRHRDLAPDGAWFVDLSEARDSTDVLSKIAAALSVSLTGDPSSAIGRIGTAIAARRRAVVVLDDFEKIVSCGPIVSELAAASPEARFVVTSREALRIPGEQKFELGPLEADDAIALFNARARGACNRDDVDALVAALDGLPLAIELAAARTTVLSPKQLREQLSRRFELLRGLRGAIDVSWELLTPSERAVLAQCAVFRSGITLAAAERVIVVDGWVLDAIESLVERSLLQVIPGDVVRYRPYESVREYALEKATDLAATRDRHAAYFASIEPVAEERDNIVAAHAHLLASGRVNQALELVVALDALLATRGPTALRLSLLDASLAAGGEGAPRARAYLRRAGARLDVGRAADAQIDRKEAERLAAGDAELEAKVLESFGFGAWHGGDIAGARAFFERSIARFPTARTEVFLANALYFLGEPDAARAHYQRAITALRAADDLRTLALAFANLGSLEHDLGNLDAARAGYLEALAIERTLGMRGDEGIAQMNLGHLALEAGDTTAARQLYSKAIEIEREVGTRRWHAVTLGYVGLCHELDGRRDEARDTYLEAIAMHDADDDAVFGGLCRCWLARLQAKRGLLDEARATLAKGVAALERGGALVFQHVGTLCGAEVALAANEPDARARADEAIAAAPTDRSSEVRIARRQLESTLHGDAAALVVSTSCRRLVTPEGTAIDLGTRAPLRRIVEALVDHRLRRPNAALTLDELVTVGWPGEKLLGTSGPDRAYAAISTLRKLGLRAVMIRRDDGYLLDPAIPLRRVED